MCRDAQRRHNIHKSVECGDPSKVWKFLKSLGIGKQQQQPLSAHLNLDLLNQHFLIIPFLIKALNLKPLHLLTFAFYEYSFFLVPVNYRRRSREEYHDCLVQRYWLLAHIFNTSVSSGVFPNIWKYAHVIPTPKIADPVAYSDYHPISILPFLSKVLERILHQQLVIFLNELSLLNSVQSGFRPGHSTATALTKITDNIRRGMDNKKLTIRTLLDFSNAFNSVDIDILLALIRK
ncbi:unnamed protein product [Pieris macdunnoughi]|uniref:Reverse transcriptase domain-containing protein n=1 Tax=Pieris macdunnoughi TaxID=345717 RepID=A0A821KYX5_9NEOP|nr:unnamed protein product [Pieris macdunnoughi]